MHLLRTDDRKTRAYVGRLVLPRFEMLAARRLRMLRRTCSEPRGCVYRDGIDSMASGSRHLVMPKWTVAAAVSTTHRLMSQCLLSHDLQGKCRAITYLNGFLIHSLDRKEVLQSKVMCMHNYKRMPVS